MTKRNLKEEARRNATLTQGNSYTGEKKTLVKGTPLDHSIKHSPYEGAKVGMSKGITKNMDNYESLRVDVWVTDEVAENETIEQAYNRISATLTEVLEETVNEVIGDEE